VAIAAYPYAAFTQMVQDPLFNITYPRLDWSAYEREARRLQPRTFMTIVLENQWLRLTILPEVGGRLYEATFKATGHNLFYANPVLKPTHWGPPQQGWWLAAGGMEWCLPVDEHGYLWGVPWAYEVIHDTNGVSVVLRSDDHPTGVRGRVTIRLENDRAAFTVAPAIENHATSTVPVKLWVNAMLAPGGSNQATENLEFILPPGPVIVHSTGDPTLPGERGTLTWPLVNGRDLSRYGTWRSWLGLFEAPTARGGFMGVYDHISGEGVVRIFPPELARGAKLFAPGRGIDPSTWTDDGSSYVEIHGGLAPTFWDAVPLGPGQMAGWSETWYPILGTDGVDAAGPEAALTVRGEGDTTRLAIITPRPRRVAIALTSGGSTAWSGWAETSPARPTLISLPGTASWPRPLVARVTDETGTLLVEAAQR